MATGAAWFPEPGQFRRAFDGFLLGTEGTKLRTPHLPHEQRTRSELASVQNRLVGAHIMQPYRLSVSNGGFPDYYDRHFMPPGGTEGGSATHPSYGGFWRERPLKHVPRPRPETDWRKQDRIDEVRWMTAIGLDLAHNDILTKEGTSTNWVNGTMELLEAIERSEFGSTGVKYIPMLDGTASIATNLADAIRSIGTIIKRPGVYKRDGFPVVMSFAPESVSWSTVSDADSWTKLYNGVKNDYGVDTRHWHVYNGVWKTQADKFDPLAFTIGHGRWGGNRGWSAAQDTTSTDISQAPAFARTNYTKKLYCFPVTTQDARWDQQRWWEAWCTTSLRENFRQAREGAAEMVQIVTWNDFRETGLMPQESSGWGWADLVSYYLEWYKFGTAPKIVRDAVYLTHREHRYDLATSAVTSTEQTLFMPQTTDSQGGPKTDVEALCFLTAPATVRMDVAGVVTDTSITQAMIDAAGGGPVSVMKPHHVGAQGNVSALLIRNGSTVPRTVVRSSRPMTISPLVQNLWYYCYSSLRQNAA